MVWFRPWVKHRGVSVRTCNSGGKLALREIIERHSGHSRVCGGGGGAMRLICRTTRNTENEMIEDGIALLTNRP